jgi:hypothetical protein
MKHIALVSGPVQGCGIFYWGSNVYDILRHSEKYKFHFVTASSYQEFLAKTHDADLIIYNWHSVTMPWCTTEVFTNTLKPQFLIHGHTLNSELIDFTGIDEFITVDPSMNYGLKNFHSGYRPIAYYDDIVYNKPNSVLKIGTSGVGHDGKNINSILNLINDQFDDSVIFNIHWSVGDYVGVDSIALEQKLNALKSLAKPNVELNFTIKRLSEYDNVKWLNNNDINLYMYNNYDCDGVSASVDKALAAKKPIGVNTTGYFRHIISDEINIDKTLIKNIINSGIAPIEKYYDMWNPKTFLEQYESIFDEFFKRDYVKI